MKQGSNLIKCFLSFVIETQGKHGELVMEWSRATNIFGKGKS